MVIFINNKPKTRPSPGKKTIKGNDTSTVYIMNERDLEADFDSKMFTPLFALKKENVKSPFLND